MNFQLRAARTQFCKHLLVKKQFSLWFQYELCFTSDNIDQRSNMETLAKEWQTARIVVSIVGDCGRGVTAREPVWRVSRPGRAPRAGACTRTPAARETSPPPPPAPPLHAAAGTCTEHAQSCRLRLDSLVCFIIPLYIWGWSMSPGSTQLLRGPALCRVLRPDASNDASSSTTSDGPERRNGFAWWAHAHARTSLACSCPGNWWMR